MVNHSLPISFHFSQFLVRLLLIKAKKIGDIQYDVSSIKVRRDRVATRGALPFNTEGVTVSMMIEM
jgi:hypothetical protein